MSPELTLENLYGQLEKLGKTANKMEVFMASGIKVGQEEDEKKKLEAKKAENDNKEEEKKEAKKAKYNSAIKVAMDEDDHDKKDAAIRKAQDEYNDKKHDAMDDNKHEATDDEKEKDAQIASIIQDKKNSLIAQILTANRLINPNGLEAIESRLKKGSITEIQKEYDIVKPFIAGVEPTVQTPQQKIIPFYANISPADIDASTLSANSPDSDFASLSTKELLEETQ